MGSLKPIDNARVEERGDERLSEADLMELRLRINKGSLTGANEVAPQIRLADVSEATGVPLPTIEETLRAIRAERAMASSGVPKEPFLVIHAAGFAALALAVGVAWVRLSPVPPHYSPAVIPGPLGGLAVSNPTVTFRHVDNGRSLPTNMVQKGQGSPPPGFRVYVANETTAFVGENMGQRVKAVSYEEDRDGLVKSAQELIDKIQHPDPSANYPVETQGFPGQHQTGPVRDYSGNMFTVGPNEVHYTFDGWSGMVAGTVAVPLTAAGKAKLLKAATDVLADEKKAQDEALRVDISPSEGIITPPPGYSVHFAGRRADVQEGPRPSFTVSDPSLVVRRMMLAIENAVLRDRKPPVGTWTRSAADEAKIPFPKESMATISDSDGRQKTFDIPTGAGWTDATARKVREEVTGFLGGASGTSGVSVGLRTQ